MFRYHDDGRVGYKRFGKFRVARIVAYTSKTLVQFEKSFESCFLRRMSNTSRYFHNVQLVFPRASEVNTAQFHHKVTVPKQATSLSSSVY